MRRHFPGESMALKLALVGIGKIARDQVEDFARRNDIALSDAQRALAPLL